MPWERLYDPHIETHNALVAVASTEVTRKVMAEFYADCLRCKARTGKDCDWRAINAAIIQRWPRGLNYIKNLAWQIALNRRG